MIDVLAFDADDTLWHNERLFSWTQERFQSILNAYHPEVVDQTLYATEKKNLQYFGYGIKGFVLSMVETAVELTQGEISGSEIKQILDFGKEMQNSPLELLPGVAEVLEAVAPQYRLMLITKGDLFDQEIKIARSGLAERFQDVEIVREKDPATYQRLLTKHQVAPERFLMVGNSLRSDILPVLEIGGHAVHVPYELTWAHEHAEPPQHERFAQLPNLEALPAWLQQQPQFTT